MKAWKRHDLRCGRVSMPRQKLDVREVIGPPRLADLRSALRIRIPFRCQPCRYQPRFPAAPSLAAPLLAPDLPRPVPFPAMFLGLSHSSISLSGRSRLHIPGTFVIFSCRPPPQPVSGGKTPESEAVFGAIS